MRKVLKNSFKCNRCKDIIESKSVHDFVTCRCGAISCDGGHEYVRLILEQGLTDSDFEDLCEFETDPRPDAITALDLDKIVAFSDEMQKLYDDVNGGTNEF